MNEKIKSPSGLGGAGGGSGPAPGTSVSGTSPAGPPSGAGASGTQTPPSAGPPQQVPNNGGNDAQTNAHPYGMPGTDPAAMSHYHHHHQQPPMHPQHLPPHQQMPGGAPTGNPGEHVGAAKDEYGQPSALGGPPPAPPGGHHPVYGRYHHGDPNMDPYRYGHAPMQQPPPQAPGGGKPQQQQQPVPPAGPGASAISSPNRPPPQRYIPGQPPQGPTPTLNSLLQSSHPPPPPQHRYGNSYDPQQQQPPPPPQQQPPPSQQQAVGGPQQQHQPPTQPPGPVPQGPHGPPPHQAYGTQQGGWAPPPRPYSPQMGPSQAYRTPPPQTTSRGPSPYPPAHGQNSGSYPSSPQQQQQPGGPPLPPQSSNQGTAPSQYSPYPQRYPTPPGLATGPNHRTAYSTHQYPEPNRPWPGGTSPAPSPGPGGHPHPPASPHQSQHGGPPPSSSPGHAPSPSPQPSQASPSPHQELIGQNSNDSSSGGAHSGMGSGPPGTPNPQQVMRPTPSPTGSSGSRSMSPAVAQTHTISRPSSNQSSSGCPPPPPHAAHMPPSGSAATQQSQQQGAGGPSAPPGSLNSSASNSPQQQGPPGSSPQGPPPPNQVMNNMSQGGYPPPPPPHMHGGYKMGGPMAPGPGQSPGPQGYPPPPQTQQYSQGNYPPRPQQYAPGGYAPTPPPSNQPASANNMPPGAPQQQQQPPPQQQQQQQQSPYPGVRPMLNHNAGAPGPHSQYPPYQNWAPNAPQGGAPPIMGNHSQGKGTPPPGVPPMPQSGGSPRPLNYLKQHLQHKGGYVAAPAPPQGYGNGPGMHPGMPMGPPHPQHGPTSMGPPTSTPPQSMGSGVPSSPGGPGDMHAPPPEHISQDNGISSSGSSSSAPGVPHLVTSVVTTGPDGQPMDEVSQQSTLSNASAASGDDQHCTTPKSRKNDPYAQSHLSASTSPGGAMHGTPHGPGGPGSEDYEMSSPPNWARTPASPQVFNSHVPPAEPFRSTNKKSDSLCKLYEMDDNPERRGWLDKLRAFMEERRTPITACPTISKQPLDLYRLYIYVKERGGFVEVTKSKTWKDIAGLLGIGASSSAAYTLRKHYTKNLLAFECHFDRGDIDPIPIIQQVEAGTKKKTTKAAAASSPGAAGTMDPATATSTASAPAGNVPPPAPSGSSNSQDSFPGAPGVAPPNTSMDGYPGYTPGYPGAPGPQPDYGAAGQMPRPPSQSNAQTPHAGSPYPAQPGAYGQYGAGDQYNSAGPPGGQFGQNQGQFPPPNRQMYPPYGPVGEAPPPGANQYGPYGNRPYSQPQGGPQVPTPSGAPNASGVPPATGPAAGPPAGAYPPPGAPAQQDYYRPPDQSPQPRRHPDFVKDSQPYPGYNARPPMYGGWQANQYRGQYPTSSPSPQGPPGSAGPPPNQQAGAPQWDQLRYPPQPGQQPPPSQPQQQPPPGQPVPGQPPYQQPPQQQQQPGQQPPGPPPQWAQISGSSQPPPSSSPGASLRPPLMGAGGSMPTQQLRMPGAPPTSGGPQQQMQQQPPQLQIPMPGIPPGPAQQPPGLPGVPPGMGMSKPQPPFQMPPPQGAGLPLGPPGSTQGLPPAGMPKAALPGAPAVHMSGLQQLSPHCAYAHLILKEVSFPPDTVEATVPLLYRRKRLNKADVCPVDPWRIFMAMRSGLLTECTWALDVLNVLLFDDTTIQYFGLTHLPGLLTILLEHFQKNLAEMFEEDSNDCSEEELTNGITPVAGDSLKCRHIRSHRKTLVSKPHAELWGKSEEKELPEDELDLGQVKYLPNPEERVLLLANSANYTMVSRKGMPVRLQEAEEDIFVLGGQRPWDIDTNKLYEQIEPLGSNPWTYGRTDRELHDGIIDVFKSEIIDIPFARYIRGKGSKTKQTEESENNESLEEESCFVVKTEEPDDDFQLQQTFNKKRHMVGLSKMHSSCSLGLADESTEAKKSKFTSAEGNENACFALPLELKKEISESSATSLHAVDSDCREVDMEIENGSNQRGSASSNSLTNGSNKAASVSFDPRGTARNSAASIARPYDTNLEDECYTRDEASLYLVRESQDSLARRCICLSNIFRNLTFVPGNEAVLAKSSRFLAILGKVLLLNHEHLPRPPKNRHYETQREEETDFSDSCSSLQGGREWWWDYLISIRENMLVALANLAGHLELCRYDEIIARPLVDGLLHWAVCPSAHGQDPFPSCGPLSSLSPQRLALEALCKLCVTDANVDLVIATPPFIRLEKLCAVLTRHLCRNEDQVLREFSVNLLHYLAAADSAMARTVALQSPCISYLVAFIEQAEQTALGVANQHGINYLRENPDSMGTSLDMLRRAAGTLLHLARHPDNRSLFMQQEQRLLGLVMSHILDQQVALIISRVLFQVSRGPGPLPSMEYRLQQRQQNEGKKSPVIVTPTHCNVAIIKSEFELKTETEGENLKLCTAVTADENSNSSHQMPSTAVLNDVSNSSINSNSCGTAASSHSNISNSSAASSSGLVTHASSNNVTEAAAAVNLVEQQHQQELLVMQQPSLMTQSKHHLMGSKNNSSNNSHSHLSLNNSTAKEQSSAAAPPPPSTPATTTAAVA